MAAKPDADDEIEIICRSCHYQMRRGAERLRRDTEIVCPNCGAVVVPEGDEREGGAGG